ncbi:PqqD family protein [Sphingomicrobium sp. XHP0235]|uniref:PqqD family protein n=1 Tax=Sphingomicrobium aquimarinum TaxID=3133971 RepID=UPI0031FEAEC9
MPKATAILPHHRIRQNRSIPTGAVDGELMALDPKAGEVYGLDPIGTRIWNAIGDGADLDQILDRLIDTHDVERDRCEADVRAFLAELESAGLVTVEAS